MLLKNNIKYIFVTLNGSAVVSIVLAIIEFNSKNLQIRNFLVFNSVMKYTFVRISLKI